MQVFIDFVSNGWNQAAIIIIVLYASLFLSFSKNTRIISTIPSFCTGIGVLLTFVVLYSKLGPGGVDLRLNAETSIDLGILIRELTAAFSTSIVGVSFSLLLNPFVKMKIRKLEKASFQKGRSKEVIEAISSHPHELLFNLKSGLDQLKVEISSLQETDGKRKNLVDIYSAVHSLSENATTKIENLFNKLDIELHKKIDALSSIAVKDAKQKVENINEAFTKQTTKLLQGNLESISQLITDHKNSVSNTAKELSQIKENLKSDIASSNDEFKDSLKTVSGEFQKSVNDMANKYKSEVAQLQGIYDNVYSTLTQMDQNIQNESQKILTNHLSKLEKAFKKIEDYQLTAQGKLDMATKKFADAVNQYQEYYNNNIEVGKKIKKQTKAITELQKENVLLLKRWDEIVKSIQSLEEHISGINNTIIQFNEIKDHIKVVGQNNL